MNQENSAELYKQCSDFFFFLLLLQQKKRERSCCYHITWLCPFQNEKIELTVAKKTNNRE